MWKGAGINSQAAHSALAAHIDAVSPVRSAGLPDVMSPDRLSATLALDGEIARQALMIAYIQDFRVMTLLGALCIPLVLLMRQPRARTAAPPDG